MDYVNLGASGLKVSRIALGMMTFGTSEWRPWVLGEDAARPIVKRAVVVADENGDDSLAIRSMMYLSLTYDHRLVDGADAGRFLQTLKARLEEGAFEADLGL